jgi:protocatechuate 4,5-dioxygenase, alpha chain
MNASKDDKALCEDIPGTYFFNEERCRSGFHLNMFCMSLLKADNRQAFLADENKYLDRYPLTAEQRRCVLERDWLGMLKVGGNIYYMSKLGATLGHSFQFLAAAMSGMSQEAYREMMIKGGRSIDGNRSKREQ